MGQDNKTGLSKGYGFVEFLNKDGYTAAVSQDYHLLEKNKVCAFFYIIRKTVLSNVCVPVHI